MSLWLGHLIEMASLFLFAWCWLELRSAGRGGHIELLVAVLYGWLLEVLDMWIFGTYHYGPMTWWWVAGVPVYIPLLWAVIMHSSMALSDHAGLPMWARPFLDGVLAVLIDLAIDAIAIRFGLWSWQIPLNEGWFGVPPGNLCAWMWVALWYGATTRLVRERINQRGEPRWHRLLVPWVAYAGLFNCLLLLGSVEQWLNLKSQRDRLWVFATQLASFLLIVSSASRRTVPARHRTHIPRSLMWNRWLMHASFLGLLVLSGTWRDLPLLVGVSLVSMECEWLVHCWCDRRIPTTAH